MKLAALAHSIGARLLGDGDIEVERVRAVDEAGARELAFASSPRELKAAYHTSASALLVDESFAAEHAHELPCAVLSSSSSSRALASAIEALHPSAPALLRGVDARAVVHESALVHDDAYVGPLAVIGASAVVHARAQVGPLAYVGDGVVVGLDARVGPGAVLLPGTRIGERAIVGPGSVIGDEGFVFAPSESANVRVRHVAGVRIGD
ncbi:MAG TPA: LpxD N-terminal domain-containing protein, partial [Myxococcota bacterium]